MQAEYRNMVLAAPVLVMMLGAFDCPIALDPPDVTPRADGGTGNSVDIGGPQGAYWVLTIGTDVTVTAREPKWVKSKTIPLTGSGQVGDCFISLASFCELTNTLCPGAVLPNPLAIIQRSSKPASPIVGFNRTGPLKVAKDQEGLYGTLVGDKLTVSLGTDHLSAAKADPCALGQASVITATVSDREGKPAMKAAMIQGTITLAYSSSCFTLTGSSSVPAGSKVELSVPFTALRK